MARKLLLIILAFILVPVQTGESFSSVQAGQEVSDAQKMEFFKLLQTLPTKGEFYTEDAARRAAPYLPVIFSLTEKDVVKDAIYPFAAISVGISADKERRAYAVAHFGEIRHPLLKLFWGSLLFNLKEVSPEIVRYLRDALDSQAQADELKAMSGRSDFKFFARAVRSHPFAQDGKQSAFVEEEGHVDWVSSVAFSPDNKTLISGSHDGTLIVWDIATNKSLRSIERHREPNRANVTSVAFSPDGKMMISAGTDKTLRFWDATTGAEVRSFKGVDYAVAAVFSPDGKKVALATCGSIVLLNALTANPVRTIPLKNKCVNHVAFSPDGRTLLNDGGTIQIRDATTGRVLKSFSAHADGIALSPDGKSILLGGEAPELWSVETGRLLRSFPKPEYMVEAVAFSPDGKTVAFEDQVGRDSFAPGIVKLWDITTGQELRRLVGHQNRVSAIVFSPDGKWVASGSWDSTVRLWDISTGELIRSFPAEKK